MQWSTAYECGNQLIDSEHRELIALANTLFGISVTSEAGSDKLRSALDQLLSHVKMHFDDEETELSKRNYRGLVWHKAAHVKLLRDAEVLALQVDSGQKTLAYLREFIVNEVVIQHMLRADRDFFALFRATPLPQGQSPVQ